MVVLNVNHYYSGPELLGIEPFYVRPKLAEDIKKAWKRLLSIPRTEALALPINVEQTTLEPTPI